jgi:hypothetical protein
MNNEDVLELSSIHNVIETVRVGVLKFLDKMYLYSYMMLSKIYQEDIFVMLFIDLMCQPMKLCLHYYT